MLNFELVPTVLQRIAALPWQLGLLKENSVSSTKLIAYFNAQMYWRIIIGGTVDGVGQKGLIGHFNAQM